jgi:ABC-type branched-subunit amino acid transport system substrate-binding protein
MRANSARSRWVMVAVACSTALSLAACAADTKDVNTQSGAVIPLTDTGGPTVAPGNCAGLKNGHGITDSTITIANASDITGLVPGLFQDVQRAVQAYVAYFNAAQSICGRKLEYLPLDSRIDSVGDQSASKQACNKAFAIIGSMAAFDSGGAKAVEDCGIPDLRTATLTPARLKSDVTFAANSIAVNQVPAVVPDYFKQKYPEAAQHAAFLYLNAGSSQSSAVNEIAGWKKRGFHFVYTQGIDILDSDYTPYVVQLKKKKVQYVQFIGNYSSAAKLAQAMRYQNFTPQIYLLDAAGYDFKYQTFGQAAVEGTRVFINSALFEEGASNEEMRRYMGWLTKTSPRAYPTYFGLFAWASARLFTEQAIALGGKLDRQTLLTSLKGVNDWTGHGLFAPQNVGKRETGQCTAIIRLEKGKWVRESPDAKQKFICGPIVESGIAGAARS